MSELRASTQAKRPSAGMAAGAVAALAIIASFEGLRTHAYLDTSGTPTVCYGETAGVRPGAVYTKPECLSLLRADVQARAAQMQRCVSRPVPAASAAWMISYGYNVGVGRFCRSVAPLVNQGRLEAACRAMSYPRVSGGVDLPGLVRRRQAEVAGCLKGLRS